MEKRNSIWAALHHDPQTASAALGHLAACPDGAQAAVILARLAPDAPPLELPVAAQEGRKAHAARAKAQDAATERARATVGLTGSTVDIAALLGTPLPYRVSLLATDLRGLLAGQVVRRHRTQQPASRWSLTQHRVLAGGGMTGKQLAAAGVTASVLSLAGIDYEELVHLLGPERASAELHDLLPSWAELKLLGANMNNLGVPPGPPWEQLIAQWGLRLLTHLADILNGQLVNLAPPLRGNRELLAMLGVRQASDIEPLGVPLLVQWRKPLQWWLEWGLQPAHVYWRDIDRTPGALGALAAAMQQPGGAPVTWQYLAHWAGIQPVVRSLGGPPQ